MRTRFIAFEGSDGAGKTSVFNRLRNEFSVHSDARGLTHFTREPGSYMDDNELEEKIRGLIIEYDMNAYSEALLFAASRAAHIESIVSALRKGRPVITDRFIYSSFVYQGIARGLGIDYISDLHKPFIEEYQCMPDLTIYFDVSYETSVYRRELSNKVDRFESMPEDFQKKILSSYLPTIKHVDNLFGSLIEDYSGKIIVVDANKPFEEVYAIVKKIILE